MFSFIPLNLFFRKKKSAVVSPGSAASTIPAKAPTQISPLIPLLGSVLLLLVLATCGIVLPPYLLSLRTYRSQALEEHDWGSIVFLSIGIECIPGCWNGGSCSARNICTCVPGFEGDRCQRSNGIFYSWSNLCRHHASLFVTAKCNQTCVHGLCATPFVCTCQPGWTGSFCDQGQ